MSRNVVTCLHLSLLKWGPFVGKNIVQWEMCNMEVLGKLLKSSWCNSGKERAYFSVRTNVAGRLIDKYSCDSWVHDWKLLCGPCFLILNDKNRPVALSVPYLSAARNFEIVSNEKNYPLFFGPSFDVLHPDEFVHVVAPNANPASKAKLWNPKQGMKKGFHRFYSNSQGVIT